MENEALFDQTYQSRYSLSPFNNRNIEPHGIEKYLATLERKNADKYNEQLNNRIAKLLKEEENTKKLMENAQKRAVVIMNNRERHMKEIQDKQLQKQIRKKQEDELRMKNFIEREKRKKNLSDVHEYIINTRKDAFKTIKQNGFMGDSALNKFKNIIQKQRAEKVHIMKFQTETKKNERSKTQLQYKNSLRQEYEKKI